MRHLLMPLSCDNRQRTMVDILGTVKSAAGCRGLELPHVLRTMVQHRVEWSSVPKFTLTAHVRPSAKGVHYADCCASAICFVVGHMQLEMR